MVIDTRSGNRTWVHEDPAQLRGFAWSPDGERLAYFAVEAGEYRLRIFDARAGSAETVALGTDNEIASSSPLVWAPDASGVLLGLRPDGWAEEARAAFVALTEAPVIVQDSRNDFLAWDRVRNIAAQQIIALVSLENGGATAARAARAAATAACARSWLARRPRGWGSRPTAPTSPIRRPRARRRRTRGGTGPSTRCTGSTSRTAASPSCCGTPARSGWV